MKSPIWLLLSFGFLLATFSPIIAQDTQENGVNEPIDKEINFNDDEEILLIDDPNNIIDDTENNDKPDNFDDDNIDDDNLDDTEDDDNPDEINNDDDNTLDIRQYYDRIPYSYEDSSEYDKRWTYKCNPDECNVRCRTLLKLPSGTCRSNGKCYCHRQKP